MRDVEILFRRRHPGRAGGVSPLSSRPDRGLTPPLAPDRALGTDSQELGCVSDGIRGGPAPASEGTCSEPMTPLPYSDPPPGAGPSAAQSDAVSGPAAAGAGCAAACTCPGDSSRARQCVPKPSSKCAPAPSRQGAGPGPQPSARSGRLGRQRPDWPGAGATRRHDAESCTRLHGNVRHLRQDGRRAERRRYSRRVPRALPETL